MGRWWVPVSCDIKAILAQFSWSWDWAWQYFLIWSKPPSQPPRSFDIILSKTLGNSVCFQRFSWQLKLTCSRRTMCLVSRKPPGAATLFLIIYQYRIQCVQKKTWIFWQYGKYLIHENPIMLETTKTILENLWQLLVSLQYDCLHDACKSPFIVRVIYMNMKI